MGKQQNSNTMRPDVSKMRADIRAKATALLHDYSKEEIERFLSEAKRIGKNVLKEFVFNTYNFFANGDNCIEDLDIMEAFTNYNTGYQQEMLNWINQNEIVIPIQFTDTSANHEKTSNLPWHFIILGLGTAFAGVMAACTQIKKHLLLASAIEIVTVVTSYCIYNKKSNENDEKQHKENLKKRDLMKEQLIDDVIKTVEEWLKLGEYRSNELLEKFDIK